MWYREADAEEDDNGAPLPRWHEMRATASEEELFGHEVRETLLEVQESYQR